MLVNLKSIMQFTKLLDKNHYERTIEQRLEGENNFGSSYDLCFKEMEDALMYSHCVETTERDIEAGYIKPDCRSYELEIPGKQGIVELDNLPEDAKLIVRKNPHGENYCLVSSGVEKIASDITHVIVGLYEEASPFMITFFCGSMAPPQDITPETMEKYNLHDGDNVSVEFAKNELGLSIVKWGK